MGGRLSQGKANHLLKSSRPIACSCAAKTRSDPASLTPAVWSRRIRLHCGVRVALTTLGASDYPRKRQDGAVGMTSYVERLERELRHLLDGVAADERPAGLGTVRFIAQCAGNSWQVLSKAKAVLTKVDQVAIEGWPANSAWREVLPDWFIARSAPEQTREQAEASLKRWQALSPDEQVRVEREKAWSLLDWLYWFQPENRTWFWWDAAEQDANKIVIAVEVDGWPFPWAALAWLFRAAGATRVDTEE